MASLGVSFHLLIEDQGLVLSANLVPLILIGLRCVLGLCQSFQSCALPLSLLLQNQLKGWPRRGAVLAEKELFWSKRSV